jgi:hypothetical protein
VTSGGCHPVHHGWSYSDGMARPVESTSWTTRLLLGVLLVIVAWWVLSALVGFVFSLIRMLLFLALFAVIAWVVLVGGRDRNP